MTTHYLALTTPADLTVRAERLRVLELDEVLQQPADRVDVLVRRSPSAA
ncbi:hypothetical protein Kpho02_21590 [Kitasatospora phosalacinea]|uniref:Uncharacterized protein n=1 Tax=Kitasatospora phosalacinea TaxID=2065 RepID=A0A9W6V2C4_9ACTN|nr:hypothetical protein [Kitasatospora phosalacinea]GLW69860.1 hypothetical protein Kpho02_21590 [Kitasatospora phosalacinea]